MVDEVKDTGLLSASIKLSERWSPTVEGDDDGKKEVGDGGEGEIPTKNGEDGGADDDGESEGEGGEERSPQEIDGEGDGEGEGEGEGEGGGSEWENLSEILEAASVETKDLSVVIKTNGEDKTVNLSEALQGYQRGIDYERRREELDTEREDFESEKESQTESLRSAASQLTEAQNALVSIAKETEDEIHAQYATVNWEDLRANNPTEWSIRRNDYQEALNENLRKSQEVGTRVEAAVKKAADDLVESKKSYKSDQLKKLVKAVPHWSDEKVRADEGKKLTVYLRDKYKATDKEIGSMLDYRSVDMARKAMLYDELVEKGINRVKTPKKSGKGGKKLLKPGSAGSRRAANTGKATARDRLKKSHSQKDATSALAERWNTN